MVEWIRGIPPFEQSALEGRGTEHLSRTDKVKGPRLVVVVEAFQAEERGAGA